MLITRKHTFAGKPLTRFPLEEENGLLGYKVGYCPGCNEPLLLRTVDAQYILARLYHSTKEYEKLLNELKPKFSFKQKFIKWLIGLLGEKPVLVENY